MKKVFVSILLSLCMIFNATAKDKAQDLPDTTQILESINYFDSGLFGQLDNGNDNLNYSAISIYNLLYALVKGSQGQTYDQLCQALKIIDSAELDNQLARDFYENDKAHYESVEVTIPKFDLTSTYDLVPVLQALGINDIFSPAQANLPDILMNGKGPQENLFVDTAIHQVRIIVNEKETKAAAVTMFASKATSAAPREPIYFTADHPFVYVIRDKKLDLNLFTGIIRNPK